MRLIVVAVVCAVGMARPKVPSKSQLIYVPEYQPENAKEAAEAPPRQDYERTPAPLPQQHQQDPSPSKSAPEIVPILKDLRASPERGVYNMAIETGNGIKVLQQVAGNHEGSKTKGAYYFTHPDGTVHKVTYVADENGFRPSSDLLPVAPKNPHPIPPHALAQIEKARIEDELRQIEGERQYEAREQEYEEYVAPEEGRFEEQYEVQGTPQTLEVQDEFEYEEAAEHQYAGEASENFPVQYDPEAAGQGPQETLYYPVLPQEQDHFPEQVPVAVPSAQPQEQEVIQINDVPIYIPEEYRDAHEDVPFTAHLVPTPAHEEEVAATPIEGADEEYLQPREASEGIPLGPLESEALRSEPLQATLHAQAESEPDAQPEPQPEPEPEPEPLAEERSADEGEEEEGYDIPHQAASTLMAAVSAAQPHAQ
ncbi:cytadherence high molecular weight protein 1-like [Penaeus indicus]|uniref:cytadherence high molecular weight protein 1-like n=1 Tax=Penaeus indicus TaxID=29960 RepID=UPI00300C2C02